VTDRSDFGMPDINNLRHQIDSLTPNIPECMSRGKIATLCFSMQVQGMAIGLQTVLDQRLLEYPDVIPRLIEELLKLSNEVFDGAWPPDAES
jgi:hypothetical protein